MKGLFRNNIADLPAPTLSNVAGTSMKVSGTIGWYKDGEWGFAYKTSAGSTWTYKKQTNKTFSNVTLSSLTASTSYDVCLYVKFNGIYQRGTVATQETTA